LADGPQAHYDVAVVGGSVLALALAWHLGAEGAQVALLAPELIGADWPTRARAWLHRTGRPAAIADLVEPARASYRAWGEAGAVGVTWRPAGHLALATSTDVARTWATAGPGRWTAGPLPLGALAARMPGIDPAPVVAAWHEPDGAEAELDELPWDLAAAAAGRGVDVFDRVALDVIEPVPAGRRLAFVHAGPDGVRSASTTVAHLVDASPELGLASAGGLGPLLVGSLERWLVTEPTGDVLPHAVAIDDVDVSQTTSGELVVRARSAPAEASWAPSDLGSMAVAAAAVVDCLPALSRARVVQCGVRRTAVGLDGLPLVGEVAAGLWCCGGFGGDELTVAPPVAELTAGALAGGRAAPGLADFDPGRPTACGLHPLGLAATDGRAASQPGHDREVQA
jgi:glycine/D-amino acid oxidase-like deaminating enzyme